MSSTCVCLLREPQTTSYLVGTIVINNPARAQALLDFWFGPPDHPERVHHKQIWFRSTAEFDTAVRENFAVDHDAAAASRLHDWEAEALSALAHVMLLDQVPRNVFRSTPRAFATSPRASSSA